jgi:hypothetical protein
MSHANGRGALAWTSFQPDGSISVGLNDRTYISSRFRARLGLWNAYNRVAIEYVVPSDPSALEPVQNPHITFHPPMRMHVKSNSDRVSQDETVFEGMAPVEMVLQQQTEMPWIRATSKPLKEFRSFGQRNDVVVVAELEYRVPAIVASASARVEIDFIRPENVIDHRDSSTWEFDWHGVGVRIRPGLTSSQIATLSWFHEP